MGTAECKQLSKKFKIYQTTYEEDTQYHLYVLEKVRRGVQSLEIDGGVSQADAEKRLRQWIIK
jgi:hypothetical protein